MASVPLLCNICPKEPEFSDISHLLTHVASKGHLFQHHEAQIRGRQDATIRGKLATYDRWHERYHIGKLLSDRRIAKETKDASSRKPYGTAKPSAAASMKTAKPRKRRATTTAKQRSESPSPVKTEGNIDPQLSQAVRATPFNRMASPFSPLDRATSPFTNTSRQDSAAKHRAHIPRMHGWQQPSLSPHANAGPISMRVARTSQPPSDYHQETETSSDYFHTFIRSPTRMAYPDPSELTSFQSASSPIVKPGRYETPDRPSDTEKPDLVQSPLLKGIKWPGMSLFDSASIEAQRRRNQKKDASILEQLEQNSFSVQQIEHIYWADGSLKQQRLITGNVESSPVRESTPPSPPHERQRTKVKAMLRDLSTNVSKRPRKPRVRKAAALNIVEHFSNSQDRSEEMIATPSPPRFIHPRTAHMGYDPPNAVDGEMQATRGRPRKNGKRAFEVFNDKDNNQGNERAPSLAKRDDHWLTHNGHGHDGLRHQNAANFTLFKKPSDKLPWDAQLRVSAGVSQHLASEEDTENIEPVNTERVTQRYFSVTGSQPPQFYNSMPPQMEFCGLAGPKYHGSTLNPLNVSLRPPQYPFYHPQTAPLLAQRGSTGNESHAEKRGHLPSSSLGRSRD